MANNYRRCSDIFSPIHSDISLNDASTLSFGSPVGTPNWDQALKQLDSMYTEKNPKIQPKSTATDVSGFEIPQSSAKKKIVTNGEKKENFEVGYDQLKRSMEDLWFQKATDISIISPISTTGKCRSTETLNFDLKVKEFKEKPMTSEMVKGTSLPYIYECPPPTSTKKNDKKSQEDTGKTRRDRKGHRLSKHASNPKESVKKSDKIDLDSELVKNASCFAELMSKSSNVASVDRDSFENASHSKESLKQCDKADLDGELGMKGDGQLKSQTVKSVRMVSSSTQTCESLQAASSNDLSKAANEKVESLWSKFNKRERNETVNPVLNVDMSLEKIIETTVGMELDKLRFLMLDQNICLMKELRKVQDVAKKHNEVTEYLLSIVEGLVEENKRLIARCK